MKLKFEAPMVINFVRTDKGIFDIADLSSEELNQFIFLYRHTLLENWQKRKKEQKQ